VHRELRRKHVTLSILWEEYIAGQPGGYRYSRYCELYRAWEGRLSVTMRQSHAAGDKLFVDYAGDGVPVVIDRRSGERRSAQIFVAVLGASSFTYAQATWTQGIADWISGHVGAFEAIGGVPALLVPDNTKVAVIKACLYDPQINRSYADMAAHYGTAILPARPRRPRDKAKVEQAVLMVERWLLGRLRHRTFHSLADVNAAIAELMIRLNEERPIRRLGVTRRKLLEEIDRPALKDLPESPYEFAEWRICRVSIDYHVEVEAHYYSVPHRFVRAEVEARFTARTVEIFHKGERIAAHQRMSGNHKHTTVPEHMASSHRRYAGWTIARIRKEAAAIGPATAALCELILDERTHPEQGFRACLGILRLARSYDRERLDAAAMRAIDIGARTYGSVKSILANNLDRRPSQKRSADEAPPSKYPRAALLQLGDPTLLTHPTLDQLHALGLHGMAKAFADIEAGGEAASLGHAEWLALLLEREASLRRDKRLSKRLQYAKLRQQQACIEDIDYRTPRGLDRSLLTMLVEGSWIDDHANLLICGPSGVGKSWLASALGNKACRDNRSVLYQRVPRLFTDLALARGDGRHPRLLRALGRVDLLLLDDWGLEPLDAAARHDLLEILEDRYGRRSTIVTSQLPVDQWHALIGDPTYADAVLDRLVHNAHRIDLNGESLRRTRKPSRKA